MPTTRKSPRAIDLAPEGRRDEIISIVADALARLMQTNRAPAIPRPDTSASICDGAPLPQAWQEDVVGMIAAAPSSIR